MKSKKVIGIIGGTGKMGKWFKKFFDKNGCKVLLSGRKSKLKAEKLIEKSDLIIFCVPISVTEKTIKKYAKLVTKGKAITDFTSLKEAPLKAMMKNSSRAVEVFGMHPVFGPKVSNIKDQSVVLCKGRGKKWFNWMKKMLTKNKARVKICSAKKHDQMMAVVQGITHFRTISFGDSLRKLKVNLSNSIDFASPIYRTRMQLLGRIMSQDPELYADILMKNKNTLKAIRQLNQSTKKLEKIIKRKDNSAFVKYFKQSSDFFSK